MWEVRSKRACTALLLAALAIAPVGSANAGPVSGSFAVNITEGSVWSSSLVSAATSYNVGGTGPDICVFATAWGSCANAAAHNNAVDVQFSVSATQVSALIHGGTGFFSGRTAGTTIDFIGFDSAIVTSDFTATGGLGTGNGVFVSTPISGGIEFAIASQNFFGGANDPSFNGSVIFNYSAADPVATPEPAGLALFAAGFGTLLLARRRMVWHGPSD